jgi:beta-mannosidase
MFVCCCCCCCWWLHRFQAEELYDLADQYGIMIWVDSMFACAQYPDSQAFLSNVAAETTQQVILLVTSPGLVTRRWASAATTAAAAAAAAAARPPSRPC